MKIKLVFVFLVLPLSLKTIYPEIAFHLMRASECEAQSRVHSRTLALFQERLTKYDVITCTFFQQCNFVERVEKNKGQRGKIARDLILVTSALLITRNLFDLGEKDAFTCMVEVVNKVRGTSHFECDNAATIFDSLVVEARKSFPVAICDEFDTRCVGLKKNLFDNSTNMTRGLFGDNSELLSAVEAVCGKSSFE